MAANPFSFLPLQKGSAPMSKTPERSAPTLTDPIDELRKFTQTETRVALAGHPIHAMMVAFPIALCFCTLGADVMYWLSGEAFWSRVALWSVGIAFGMGVLAGIAGTVELLIVPGIRLRSPSWSHFILAVMLISILGANWAFRWGNAEAAVLPVGILTSALAAFITALTGWHGGKLVFDYGIGVQDDHGKDS